MKTSLKLNLWVLAVVAIVAASCKGKSGSDANSGSAASSGSEAAAVSKSNSVVDSLNITDPDEKKVCALYDECITDYLKEMKTLGTDTSKADADTRRKALDQKYQDKVKEIQPQIDNLKNMMVATPGEAMKWVQFSTYEAKRMAAGAADYTKNIMKNYAVPAAAKP